MKSRVAIRPSDILPEHSRVLHSLGMPEGASAGARIDAHLHEAFSILLSSASPKGLFMEVSIEQFADVYRGEGRNAEATPLEEIFPRAACLALFVATLGQATGRRIDELFEQRDFALASILDAVASEATENAAEIVENAFRDRIRAREDDGGSSRSLRYSPGYCGWHISGQKSLFKLLGPETIGVSLRESFLMEPLKSISGVIVAGPAEIHAFEDSYPFCAECLAHSCRERIRHTLMQSAGNGGRESL
jgi:hypothetical protein